MRKRNILKFNTKFIISTFILINLFLYTYSQGVNTGVLYARLAIIMFYSFAVLFILYHFIILGYKIPPRISLYDLMFFIIIFYIIFNTILYPKSLISNINISLTMALVFFIYKILLYESNKFGIAQIIKKYEFLFNVFISFIFISTIVAFINEYFSFSIFPIPDITYFKRAQSWFNNSTMYGINISIVIILLNYKLHQIRNLFYSILVIISIVWFLYWLVLSGGRSGPIILLIGLFFYTFLSYKGKSLFYFSPLIIIVIFQNQIYSYLTTNFLLFRRFSYGGFGGREDKFLYVFNLWKNQNAFYQLFGSGTNSLRDEFLYSAHSGFLKLFFDNGLIFVGLYLTFMIIVTIKYFSSIYSTKNKRTRSILITGFSIVVMMFIAEFVVIIAMSAIYDFIFLLLLTSMPLIILTKKSDKN